MAFLQLSQTLADSFHSLADEVQSLADTRTVLEHKLRFAHEQFQYLADKYAPAAPEIADTLANLQLPAHTSVDHTSSVPLPPRSASPPSQHQIAVVIRDGRRAASRLASLGDASKTTASSRDTLSHTSHDDEASSMSTALEQDFTVQGKKGSLECPFSIQAVQDPDSQDHVDSHHDPDDPICAMDEVSTNDTSALGKCPIRFLDRHSPEEVARYVEMHKHELPRSHEVCLNRYQRSEEQVRKLDSKYGNIANLIEDLGQLHKPMLPEAELQQQQQQQSETDDGSNRRVENWAEAVGASSDVSIHGEEDDHDAEADDERQSHFDRPLKEVRVGESPSRPWGISVPIYDTNEFENDHVLSPPPAPVRMPSRQRSDRAAMPSMPPMAGMTGMAGMAKMMGGKSGGGKCPFDHTKLAAMTGSGAQTPKAEATKGGPGLQEAPSFTPAKEQASRPQASSGQPVFMSSEAAKTGGGPQMVFTGPVFIGYPMDQAIQFMNQYRPSQ